MSSKWGSFIQQAVAGVEARLDNILAEGEAVPSRTTPTSRDAPSKRSTASGALAASPPADTNRSIDSLQERLAKAVGSKPGTPAPQTPRNSGAFSRPRQSTGEGGSASPRSSTPTETAHTSPRCEFESPNTNRPSTEAERVPSVGIGSDSLVLTNPIDIVRAVPSSAAIRKPVDADAELIEEPRLVARTTSPGRGGITQVGASIHGRCADCGALRSRLDYVTAPVSESDPPLHDTTELHSYVERVDALESKLRYLANEATGSARKAASAAPSDSVEKCIAEKDEKISLLMVEGQALASTEQKHRALIKKLRSKIAENERITSDTNREKDQAHAELERLRKSAARVEELEESRAELQGVADSLKKDVSTLRLELEDQQGVIVSLAAELERTGDASSSAKQTSLDGLAESQLNRLAELEETVASLAVERNLIADRARLQAAELRGKVEQAIERESRVKGEMQLLEGKLEAMRIVAEEASSSAVSDSQVKLLRQVETLQSQYASARENWQGIEASLNSRLATLEKEREDALRRESEMRKRAKEMSSRCRQQGEEVQSLRDQVSRHRLELEASLGEIETLRRRAEAAEATVTRAHEENKRPKNSNGEGCTAIVDTNPTGTTRGGRIHSRPHSPLSGLGRTLSSDVAPYLPSKPRMPSASNGSFEAILDRPSSIRRPSGQTPLKTPTTGMTVGTPSSQGFHGFESPIESPSGPQSVGRERDEASDHIDSLSIPQQSVQDVVSVSTVAAGPSIQLVERMSAAIRRLEAEKVATKEELARISSQRDEARAEIVSLLKEMESGRAASKRTEELEKDVAEVKARYETTLEMLGEKSELVEELRADVQDVKAMYRELVERTVR